MGAGPAQEFVGQLAYDSGKAASEAATRAIAHEIGPLGITIKAVAPGPGEEGRMIRMLHEGAPGAGSADERGDRHAII